MTKHPLRFILGIVFCALIIQPVIAGDIEADNVVVDRLETLSLGVEPGQESLLMRDGLSASGILAVDKISIFSDGIELLIPRGDVSMGSFTNMPGSAVPSQLYPSWWLSREVIGTNAVCDYAAAVQGQIKWIARQAGDEIQDRMGFAGGMGAAISNQISSFSPTNNSIPVTLGQLKHTVAPFYDRLATIGIVSNYPWSGPAEDFALANVGQAKKLFSFDFTRDSDGDGMPNVWEAEYGFSWSVWQTDSIHGPGDDADGDGVSNAAECTRETNPINPASANRMLYADSAIGSDSYDGLSSSVRVYGRGPKASVLQTINAALSKDVIELRGTPAFSDRTLATGSKEITLVPVGSVRF